MAFAGETRGAAHEEVTPGRTGERDDDALAAAAPPARGRLDVGGGAQLVGGAVGHPPQGHLAKCGEVRRPERVGQRGVHPIGSEDVAVGEAAAQGFG